MCLIERNLDFIFSKMRNCSFDIKNEKEKEDIFVIDCLCFYLFSSQKK